MKRRSFISSIVAALAMSPFLCRMAKAFHVEQVDIPVEEGEMVWDGAISPYFLKNYQSAAEGSNFGMDILWTNQAETECPIITSKTHPNKIADACPNIILQKRFRISEDPNSENFGKLEEFILQDVVFLGTHPSCS